MAHGLWRRWGATQTTYVAHRAYGEGGDVMAAVAHASGIKDMRGMAAGRRARGVGGKIRKDRRSGGLQQRTRANA